MATYNITSPDGKVYKITAPDNASEAEVLAYAQRNYKMTPKEGAKAPDPTEGMSTGQKILVGVGKGMTDIGYGVGQMLNLVSREDVAKKRETDRAIMNTGAGQVGNFIGNAAVALPAAFIPGANTVAGASLVGAGLGLAQPSTSTKETLTNVAFGGAGGAAGQAVANRVPGMLRQWQTSAADDAARQAAQASQKFAAAKAGNQAGYVIPPADLNPGMISEALSGLSGKIKTAQVASQRNQGVTDKLARNALGLADDAQLDSATLAGIRSRAGQAYQAVSSIGQVNTTKAYLDALDEAVKPFVSQSKSFPGRGVPKLVDDIQSLKTGAFDAGDAIETIKVLRNDADAAYRAGDKLAGKAYKKASEALEQAIDDHLVKSGAPADLLKGYRSARQQIAKSYTVENALNPQTGSINAPKLAKDLERGKPLIGELRQIAEFAQAFPKASQALKEAPKATSPLDWAVGAMSGTATGNPLMLAGIAARPAVRSALLSAPVQRAALKPGFAPSLASRTIPSLIDTDPFRMLAMPLGVTGGLLATPAN